MEKEIVLGGIIRPKVFDAFVYLTLVFDFLKVLDDLFLCARTQSPIQQFVAGGRPRGVFQF